jgi:hypothetical protein
VTLPTKFKLRQKQDALSQMHGQDTAIQVEEMKNIITHNKLADIKI